MEVQPTTASSSSALWAEKWLLRKARGPTSELPSMVVTPRTSNSRFRGGQTKSYSLSPRRVPKEAFTTPDTEASTPPELAVVDANPIPEDHMECIQQAFGVDVDLYRDILKVPRHASTQQIRIAYFRQGRKVLAQEDYPSAQTMAQLSATSKRRFEAVSMAFEILSTPKWRAFYDRRGFVRQPRRALTPPLPPRHIRWNEQVEELLYNEDPAEQRFKTGGAGISLSLEDLDDNDFLAKRLKKGKPTAGNAAAKAPAAPLIADAVGLTKKLDKLDRTFVSEFLDNVEASLDGLESHLEDFFKAANHDDGPKLSPIRPSKEPPLITPSRAPPVSVPAAPWPKAQDNGPRKETRETFMRKDIKIEDSIVRALFVDMKEPDPKPEPEKLVTEKESSQIKDNVAQDLLVEPTKRSELAKPPRAGPAPRDQPSSAVNVDSLHREDEIAWELFADLTKPPPSGYTDRSCIETKSMSKAKAFIKEKRKVNKARPDNAWIRALSESARAPRQESRQDDQDVGTPTKTSDDNDGDSGTPSFCRAITPVVEHKKSMAHPSLPEPSAWEPQSNLAGPRNNSSEPFGRAPFEELNINHDDDDASVPAEFDPTSMVVQARMNDAASTDSVSTLSASAFTVGGTSANNVPRSSSRLSDVLEKVLEGEEESLSIPQVHRLKDPGIEEASVFSGPGPMNALAFERAQSSMSAESTITFETRLNDPLGDCCSVLIRNAKGAIAVLPDLSSSLKPTDAGDAAPNSSSPGSGKVDEAFLSCLTFYVKTLSDEMNRIGVQVTEFSSDVGTKVSEFSTDIGTKMSTGLEEANKTLVESLKLPASEMQGMLDTLNANIQWPSSMSPPIQKASTM